MVVPEHRGAISREILDDARRIAYLSVAPGHSRELIVRDAYRRVLHHELIDGCRAGPGAPPPRAPRATQPQTPNGGRRCQEHLSVGIRSVS